MVSQRSNILASLCVTSTLGGHLLSFIDMAGCKRIIGETGRLNVLRGCGGRGRALYMGGREEHQRQVSKKKAVNYAYGTVW